MHALHMPYFMTLTEIELTLDPYQKLFKKIALEVKV